MSKSLPYFKFISSEWNDGDITLCSLEAQGLFINLCSLYWSKEGVLSYTKNVRRFNGCNTSVWDEIISDNIIEVVDDMIIIRFLDNQLEERQILSEQNRLNVLKRWNNYDGNTSVQQSNTIKKREEKKREEKRREEGVVLPFDSKEFLHSWDLWKDYKKKEFKFSFKTKQSEQAAITKLNTLSFGIEKKAIEIINESMAGGWKGFYKLKNNGNTKAERERSTLLDPTQENADWLNGKS